MTTNNNDYINYLGPVFFPDGTPVPELLTKQEAIKFLRLDEGGTKHPEMSLQYYRSEGLLKATKVGKRLRYQKKELLRFLDELTQRTNGDIS